MKTTIMILFIFIFSACHQLNKKDKSSKQISKPEAVQAYVPKRQLASMKPKDYIRLLKENCCEPVLVDSSNLKFWKEKDLKELKSLVGSREPSSAVVSVKSKFSCQGEEYISTVGREAQHLLDAIKKGQYPLSLCSTYDYYPESENK